MKEEMKEKIEFASNVSKNIPFGRIFRSKVQKLTRVFNYLHDSNSIFWPSGINSE